MTEPRTITRLYTIGLKDRPTILIATCSDNTVWELDRSTPYDPAWERLPDIPAFDEIAR